MDRTAARSRTTTRLLGVAVGAGALLAVAVGPASAAGPARITDRPGDARDILGRNQPTADLLAVQVALGGSTVTFTDTLAKVGRSEGHRYGTTLDLQRNGVDGNGGALLISELSYGEARLTVTDRQQTDGTSLLGTIVYGPGNTVSAVYDRADVHASLAAIGSRPLRSNDKVLLSGSSFEPRWSGQDTARSAKTLTLGD